MSRSCVNTNTIHKMEPFERIQLIDWEAPEFGAPETPSDITKRVANKIEGLAQNHLVLFAEEYPCLVPAQVPTASFTETPSFMEGRKRTRQGVFAGKLAVGTEVDFPAETFVAIKPYDRRMTHFLTRPAQVVAHDWAINNYLNSISSGTAYQPHGLWRNHDTFFVPALLTRLNERSVSLDNIFNAHPEDGEALSPGRIRRALELGHFGLGIANGAHMIHGDAFPQNFARDGKRVIFNDTTTLRPYGQKPAMTQKKIREDVEDFLKGVFHPEASSPEARTLSLAALKDSQYVSSLYQKYIAGARLGAERAGHSSSGLVVDEEAHRKIVNSAVQKNDGA